MGDMIPLNLLSAGETGLIGQLVGQPDEVHRLEELGLRSGTAIEMVQPGSPCIVRLAGAKLCFRDCESFRVFVQPAVAR